MDPKQPRIKQESNEQKVWAFVDHDPPNITITSSGNGGQSRGRGGSRSRGGTSSSASGSGSGSSSGGVGIAAAVSTPERISSSGAGTSSTSALLVSGLPSTPERVPSSGFTSTSIATRGTGPVPGSGSGRGVSTTSTSKKKPRRKRQRTDFSRPGPGEYSSSDSECDEKQEPESDDDEMDEYKLDPRALPEFVKQAAEQLEQAKKSGNERAIRAAKSAWKKSAKRLPAQLAEKELEDADTAERINQETEEDEKHGPPPPPNPIIIALYAEKGGVGKTTLATTLAYLLASTGHRVLVYDCDAQRSLTAWLFGDRIRSNEFNGEVTEFIRHVDLGEDGTAPNTLYDQFFRAFHTNTPAVAARARKVRHNLWLVPGHRQMSSIDEKISVTEALTGAGSVGANAITGALYHAVIATARAYRCEYVLLDLNPSSAAMNRTMIMACSHYLVVPAIADFFSTEMMRELRTMLHEWHTRINQIRASTLHTHHPLPPHHAKFIGYVLNRYIPCRKSRLIDGVAEDKLRLNEERWAEAVRVAADKVSLNNPLAISQQVYNHVSRKNVIGEIREFWGLSDLSDINLLPVPFLRRLHMRKERNGQSEPMKWEEADDKIIKVKQYRDIFLAIMNTIKDIIQADRTLTGAAPVPPAPATSTLTSSSTSAYSHAHFPPFPTTTSSTGTSTSTSTSSSTSFLSRTFRRGGK